MKRIVGLSLIFFLVLSLITLSWAMMCGGKMHLAQAQSSEATTQEKKAIDVGNKICPVSGEKIDQNLKATYEYEGKIYNFCCTACIEEFKKDPEKYIKKIEEELQSESKGQSEHEEHGMEMMHGSGTSHQGMHQGHNH